MYAIIDYKDMLQINSKNVLINIVIGEGNI